MAMDIAEIEKSTGRKISWHMDCNFYADSDGHLIDGPVLLYQTEVTFHCHAANLDVSFESLDVLYVESVLRSEAIAFAKGEIPKVHRLNLFSAMFKDTVTWLELEGKKMIFLDMKGTEFKQLLSIAQAKQKYSHTVAGSTGK